MYISVRVIAGAKQEEVRTLAKGRLAVSVKQPARQNLANKRVRELVALHFKLPLAKVQLVSGAHTPAKLFALAEK
jgi:uncharacterized protein YggU (UPF0235/DUF167 family)